MFKNERGTGKARKDKMGFLEKKGKRSKRQNGNSSAAGRRRREVDFIDLEDDDAAYDDTDYESDDAAYTEDDRYADDGEYTEENGEYEDGEYVEDGEYTDEDGQYAEDGEYIDEDGEYAGEDGQYAEDGEYTDEDGEYAGEDGEYTDDGQYVEEDGEYTDEDGEYVEEDGEYAGEDGQYADEDGEYTDDGQYAEDGEYTDEDGEYVEEDGEYAGEDGRYADEDGQYEEYDDSGILSFGRREKRTTAGTKHSHSSKKNKKNNKKNKESAPVVLFHKFQKLPPIDRVLAMTGAAVLLCAVLTGTVLAAANSTKKEVASFAEVGTDLENVDVIGGTGLVAMNDAQTAKAAELLEQESTESETASSEAAQQITVKMKSTSIVKDLKLKFVNSSSDKLIASVPFEVEVTGPDKKTSTWTDDDKDGVIYKKDLAGGTYKVQMVALGSEYSNYQIDTKAQSVEVAAKIAYKKVDVVEEVKTEAEVNVAKEDTAVVQTPIESQLTDTVPFVASTITDGDGTGAYTAIDKSTISDPSATAQSRYKRMSATTKKTAANSIAISASTASLAVGDSQTLTATAKKTTTTTDVSSGNASSEDADISSTVTWSSSDPSVATVSGGKVTAVKAGTATITASVDGASATCTVTVADTSITLSATTLTVAVGSTGTLTATLNPSTATITKVVSSKKIYAQGTASGTTITVTGKKAGTVTLTVTASTGKTATCEVTVKASAELDTTSKLKDKSGNQVYVSDNGNYREAVFADYYTASAFYIQSKQKVYTGWQNIDGKTFYYLADHTYVTGDQVIQGAKYSFGSDGVLQTGSGSMGIDVSKWNGSINWSNVASSGVSYAIIRCGYRGSSTGALITDPKFTSNISGASQAGLKVGVYFFTQAVNEAEAVEEASMVLSQVSKYKLSYPIFLDVESSHGRADGIDAGTRTAVVKAFCATIANSGYTAGVYANKTWLSSKMDAGALGSYKIWLAQYAATPNYSGHYNLWQYTSKGSVNGISGKVDLNLSYLGY